MERKTSSLAGPLWVVGIGLCILGVGVFFMASVISQKRKVEEEARISIAAARLKVTSETVTTTQTTTTFAATPVRSDIVSRTNPAPTPTSTPVTVKPPTLSAAVTPPITAPKKADFFGLAGGKSGWSAMGGPKIFGRITSKGTPPPEKELPLDPACGQLHSTQKPTTRFYVVGPNAGLGDVVVSIRPGARMIEAFVKATGKRGEFPIPTDPLVIVQVGCEYVSYVSAARAGQSILVVNSDPMLHNVHPTPAHQGNPESNRAQLPGAQPLQFVFPKPEPFLRFKCEVHPWMFAYVSTFDHPFFAVTDATGAFQFPAPPPGRYTIEATHRKSGTLVHDIEVRANENLEIAFEMQVPAGNQ